jgi:metal-sulfur cluster biosynthetic enzyme
MMGYENTAMAGNIEKVEGVRRFLRGVGFPGFQRDIVAAGFIKDIQIEGSQVIVHFAPNTTNQAKVEQMEADIRDALIGDGHFERVEIEIYQPFDEGNILRNAAMTPLQAEMVEDGITPQADMLASDLQRPDLVPQAGYDEDGPEPLGGPRSDVYEGELPVFQWDIDPHDPNARSGTANLTIGDWDFRVWWQVHKARLVYASIQALKGDWVEHEGAARSHPVGRTEAVNLVYDLDRKAVVAIYGTVQDFRPFVDAFYRGYVLKN